MLTEKEKRHLFHYSRSWHWLSKYIFYLHRLFYRSIVVTGREHIPSGVPIIFAPNHQNALMDPLAVLLASKRQIVFLARADIFRRPLLKRIFTWMKILPVFRIRDGKDNLQFNEQSFEVATQVLEHGQSIGIFPEAAHSDKRTLLPLKKGIPRIAFLSEEQNGFKLGLRILPVGIYYSRYDTMGGILHIRFGQAVSVGDFEEAYRENAQKAHLQLRDAIAEGIRPLAIDISKKGWYEIYESLLSLLTRRLAGHDGSELRFREKEFIVRKQIIALLDKQLDDDPSSLDIIKENVEAYEALKKKYQLTDKSLLWRWPVIPVLILGSLLIIAGLPLFLYGFINHIPAYFIPRRIIRLFKDKQFHSSVKFLWGAFVMPMLYVLQSLIVWAICGKLWIAALYLLSLPLSGIYAHWFAAQARFMITRWRLFFLKRMVPGDMKELKRLLHAILEDASRLISM